MAKKQKRSELKQDNQPTNGRCPNGHSTQVHVNVQGGEGRVFCPTCQWDDSKQVIGRDPDAQFDSVHRLSVERQRPVTIVGGAAEKGVQIVTKRG